MKGKVAFLFGSGISYKSGGPKVAAITESLFERKWREGTDRSFYPLQSDSGDKSVGLAETVKAFLQILRAHLEPYLHEKESRGADYEDLYSAVQQIVCDESRELTNPLISISVGRIRDATSFLWVNLPPHIDRTNG